MSYVITLHLNTAETVQLVESSVWHYANGGTWSECDGEHTLTMGGSGTSGMLRFKPGQGDEAFSVAMGVHNYKPWVDIITGLASDVTCVASLPGYYNGSDATRVKSREAQRVEQSILNAQSRTIAAEYKVAEGHNLELDITIA